MTTTAMDVGGSHVTVARITVDDLDQIEVGPRTRWRLDPHGSASDILGVLAAAARGTSVAGDPLSIAIPGPFDFDTGVGWFAGVDKFESLNGVDVRAALSRALEVSPNSLHFVKDSDAYARGEAHSGAAADLTTFVCLTLGTGIGSAFVRDGVAVHDGPLVPPDGEMFRTFVDGAPLEHVAAPRAIEASYRARSGSDSDMVEICRHARTGDPLAIKVLREAMDALGRTVGPWVRSFDAEAIVIGGSVAGSSDILFPWLEERLAADNNLPAAGVRRAKYDELAALIGAALAMDAVERRPLDTTTTS